MKSDNEHIARLEEIGSRLAVDADGCVWWVHSDGAHSMVRTNPDNNPTPMPFTFYVRAPSGLTEAMFEPLGDLRPIPGPANGQAEERAERAEMVDSVMRAAGLE